MTDGVEREVKVDWPYGGLSYNNAQPSQETWQGTLLQQKRDGVGTLYRRNRSYDPGTGRFTQEDPIGLAGGMNLYGFAGGDPVSYSDPFGLCPYGKGNRNYDTSDCDDDKVGNAMRALDSNGGEIGKQTIRGIADNGLNPTLVDSKTATDACGASGVCTLGDGKTIYMPNSRSTGDIAGHLAHEVTHTLLGDDQFNISRQYAQHEVIAWRRSLIVEQSLPSSMRGSWFAPYLRAFGAMSSSAFDSMVYSGGCAYQRRAGGKC